MSLFRQSTDQFRSALAEMPMQSRIISMMLVVAIAIGLGLLVRGGKADDTVYLFGNKVFSEQELNEAVIAFGQAGLSEWDTKNRRIEVPRESRAAYLAVLSESSSVTGSLQTSVRDAIDKTSHFESSEHTRSRLRHAKERDLGASITAFPDIQWASVQYDEGERVGLRGVRTKTASVILKPEGSQPLTDQRMKQIQEFVHGSYADLNQEDVVVTDTNGNSLSSSARDEDPLLRKQQHAEAYYEQKVRSVLTGYGDIRVAAHAEVDPTMEVETQSLKYDKERTTLQNTDRIFESTSNRPAAGGQPGTGPNATAHSNGSVSIDKELATKTKETEKSSGGVVGQSFENARVAALQVKQVHVSVILPASYYDKVWSQRFLKTNPDKTPQDVPLLQTVDLEQLREETKSRIQSSVTKLLPPVEPGANKIELVEVTDYPDLPDPVVAESDVGKVALTWLAGSWQTIALVMLALVALLVARSAAGTGGSPAPDSFAEGFGIELPKPPAEAEEPENGSDHMTITGSTLKDELVQLVEQNPEVAANVIRSWVGEAA